MSLVGKDTAVPVIGISCQPALQLRLNREHVSTLVGEPMAYTSSFFNWLMFSVDEVPWLLERMIWHGEGYRGGQVFRTHGVVYVPDPYEAR